MANFCPNCGTKLSEEGKCTQCHFEDNSVFSKTKDVLNMATTKINELAGESGAVNLNILDLFSEVFHKHTTQESEEIFISGTATTTPHEKYISSTWPRPWLFSRVFIMFLITFFSLFICYDSFRNINALPGMIFIGAIAVPVSLVIFFMEVNAPRNISFFETMKVFFIGGGASLVTTLLLYSFTSRIEGYIGAIFVGFIEEIGKLIVIAYFIKKIKNIKYVLNGLLIGAAVGAGFATFETAGYILRAFFYGNEVMMDVLVLRAFLAPGGHVIWGAIIGASLVLAKGCTPFNASYLTNKKFLSFFLLCVAMHSIWDMPINIKYNLVPILMTVCAWIITLVLVDVGLKEISKCISLSYESTIHENEKLIKKN